MRRATPLLALLLLALGAGPAPAQEKESKLVLSQRIDCRGPASPETADVPKNSVLIAFDDASLKGADEWIVRDKAGLVRAVNQLLAFYGIDAVRAREYPLADAKKFYSGNGDVTLDYASNSFLLTVTNTCRTIGSTNSFLVCDEDECGAGDELFGPETRHYVADSCVQGMSYMPDEVPASQRIPRLRAYLAAIMTHEIIHAAHARVLGDLLASEPAKPPKACAREIPLAKAVELTRKLRADLGIPCGAMHMSGGLMTAGITLKGDPCDHMGGYTPNMGQCMADPKVPAALFNDLGALAASGVPCTTEKVAVREFFNLPARNVAYIQRHLTKAAAAGCHAACYYRVAKAPRRP